MGLGLSGLRLGLVRMSGGGTAGPAEMHSDPGFDDPGAWTAIDGYWVVSGGVATITAATSQRVLYDSTFRAVLGRTYRVSLDVVSTSGTNGCQIRYSSSLLVGSVPNATGSYTMPDYTVISNAAREFDIRSLSGTTMTIDNFSILDVTP